MSTATPPRTGLDRILDTLRSTGVRRDGDRWVAGVSGGIAERTGVAVQLVRAAFIVAAFLLGIGVIAYLTLWLVTPGPEDEIPLELALREGDLKSVVLLVVVVLGLLGGGFGDAVGDNGVRAAGGLLWTLAVVGAVIWLVRRSRRQTPSAPPATARVAPPPPPGGTSGPMPGAGTTVTATPAAGTTVPLTPGTDAIVPLTTGPGVVGPDSGAGAADPRASAEPGPGAGTTDPAWPADTIGHATPVGATTPLPSPDAHRSGYAGWTASAPVTYRAPRPRRVRRRGPGLLLTLGTLGAMAVTGGLVTAAGGHADWAVAAVPLSLAAALLVGGLTVVVLGARGRRSGLVGAVSALLLVGTLGMTLLPAATWVRGPGGQVTWTPTGDQELTLSGGQGVLSLAKVPESEGTTDLRVRAGAGMVVLAVPPGATVHVTATTHLGRISSTPEAARLLTDGPNDVALAVDDQGNHILGGGKDITVERVYGSGGRRVNVTIDLGVGEVLIRKEA